MANHALFCPQWEIRNPVFRAESLLYWDRLACIVPFKGFAPRPSDPDQEKLDEYLERLCTVQGVERDLIVREFEDEFRSNLALFQRELRRAGLDAFWSKEGLVAVFAGATAGTLDVGVRGSDWLGLYTHELPAETA